MGASIGFGPRVRASPEHRALISRANLNRSYRMKRSKVSASKEYFKSAIDARRLHGRQKSLVQKVERGLEVLRTALAEEINNLSKAALQSLITGQVVRAKYHSARASRLNAIFERVDAIRREWKALRTKRGHSLRRRLRGATHARAHHTRR